MPTLNLGIVAHVDAGKTTLTERLLYETGVISSTGRVDHGDTTTDTDALERQRGITIRSAVVTFTLGDVKVNLIDTPGHSDFVAEVERALSVLDGAVLVVSAVEGVQAQTRVLIRILERLQLPFLIFVNKVDRTGADEYATLAALRGALTGDAVVINLAHDLGSRAVTVEPRRGDAFVDELTGRLSEYDDEVLSRYVEGSDPMSESELLGALSLLTTRGRVHPVYLGSALAGIGVEQLMDGLRRFLPPLDDTTTRTLHGTVFKIERDTAGHRVAYVRLHSGTLAARDPLALFHRSATGSVVERAGRATAVSTFDRGTHAADTAAHSGDIAKVAGLAEVEIGDQLGGWDPDQGGRHFAPPGLEAVVQARHPADRPALFEALRELAEQDPLIDARLDGIDREITVSLYGEVQKEVLSSRLAVEFGLETEFSDIRTVYVERMAEVGEAVEVISSHNATVGLRVEAGPVGSGFGYRLGVERGWLLPSFHTAIEETLATELREGPCGWRVIDGFVTLTHAGFSAPTPPAGYFRHLTALALGKALDQAGTIVCEPFSAFEVEFPAETMNRVLQRLSAAQAAPEESTLGVERGRVIGVMPTASVHRFEQRLPDLTQGQGVFLSRPAGYRPVSGPPPRRRAAVRALR